jgi:RNA 2',3'-cyclic 3'-phosphodiesterase
MRLFIAVDCPTEVRDRLAAAQKDIAACGDMKPVEYENLHITVKFIGEADEPKAEMVKTALSGVRHPAFTVSVKGVGAFPNPGGAKVVWAGIEDGRDELMLLHRKIDDALEPLGFEPDRKFHPHITLARVRGSLNPARLIGLLTSKADLALGSYPVSEYALTASTLTIKGPIYSKTSDFPLK